LPFLIKIKNSVIRSDFFKKLANELGSDESAIIEESKKYLSANTASAVGGSTLIPPKLEIPPQPSKTEKLEELLITLILGSKSPSKLSKKFSQYLNQITSLRLFPISKNLLIISSFEPKSFQDSLPAENQPLFQTLFLNATAQSLESKKRFLEISKTIDQIDSINIKDQLNNLSTQIARLENNVNSPDLEKLEKDYNQLLSRLAKIQTKKS